MPTTAHGGLIRNTLQIVLCTCYNSLSDVCAASSRLHDHWSCWRRKPHIKLRHISCLGRYRLRTTFSVRTAYIAGAFGSLVGVSAGILSIILFTTNEAVYETLHSIRDVLWVLWPAFQGLGFAGLSREHKAQSARLAFLSASVAAIAQFCLLVIFTMTDWVHIMLELWAALGLASISLLARATLTIMMISAGIALLRTSQHARLRCLSSCAGYICMITGILILLPLMQGLVFIPNLLLAFLFASEIGSE